MPCRHYSDSPRIYVASLSDYNAGVLHGVWIDANQSAEKIHEHIAEMLEQSPERRTCQNCGKLIRCVETRSPSGSVSVIHDHGEAEGNHTVCDWHEDMQPRSRVATPGMAEEWAIHDYDNFGPIRLDEYESIEVVADLAALLDEHGEAFGAYVAYEGVSEVIDDMRGAFEEAYQGEWDSLGDYAYQLAEDMGAVNVNRRSQEPSYERDLSSEWPFTCIDWERAARELELGGDIWTADSANGVYVFNGNA